MPLPTRKPDESFDDFIERCMGDDVMVQEFPDRAQRYAVCHKLAKRKARSNYAHVTLTCQAQDTQIITPEEEDKPPQFTLLAYTGGPMNVGGWDKPVVVDLAGLQILKINLPVRFNHSIEQGVGHTTSIQVVNNQLIAQGIISRDTPAAREIVASAKKGFPWQASIGADVINYKEIKQDEVVQANGREFKGPLYLITNALLVEISFVDLGADVNTSATVMASFSETKGEDMEDVKTPEPQVEAQPATTQQEVERILAIRKVCEGKFPEIEAKAIEEGWDVKKTALEVLRAARPKAPAVHVAQDVMDLPRVITCSLRMRGNDSKVEKEYDEKTLEAAYKMRRASLVEIAQMCCQFEGADYPLFGTPVEKVKAAFSTRTFTSILSNVAHKILLDAYKAVPMASLTVARKIDVPDFKEASLARLTGDYKLKLVAPDGELEHATVSDQGYTIKADTYGRIVGLTRQDVLNDDLGAFLDVPRQLGRGAALAVEGAFWSMVEGASTFFSSSNKNVSTGALSINTLSTAVGVLRKQTDENGNPIAARPKYLVVPPDLEALAQQIYTSTTVLAAGVGNAEKLVGVNNPHVGKYEPVVSEFLTGSGTTSTWYLVADPNDVPAFGVAFVNGQDTPVIEEADPDPKFLGVIWRAYIDFGTALLDPRGAVKVTAS